MVRFNMRKAKGYVCNDCGYFTEDEDEKRKHELSRPEPRSLPEGFVFKSTIGDLAEANDSISTKQSLLSFYSPEEEVYQLIHHLHLPDQKDHNVIHGIFAYEPDTSKIVLVHNKFNYEQMEQLFYTKTFQFITDQEFEEFRRNHNLKEFNDKITNRKPDILEERLALRG